MTLGKRIQAARKASGKSQKEVAEHFKISPQAVSGWERDEVRPDYDKLSKIARLLNVTGDYLLSGEGAPDDAEALRAAINRVPKSQRRRALQLLRLLEENDDTEAA